MMNLYLVESTVANQGTDLLKARPCSAKIIRLIGASSCIFRDGSADGRIVARLAGSAETPVDTLQAGTGECFTFEIGIWIQMAGSGTAQAYLFRNPVGPQGP